MLLVEMIKFELKWLSILLLWVFFLVEDIEVRKMWCVKKIVFVSRG